MAHSKKRDEARSWLTTVRNVSERPSWVFSDRTKFLVLMSFIAIVTFMGGGSRSDISSLLFLRPISVVYGFYAVISMRLEDARRVRAPLLVLLGMFAIAIFQVIPLPRSFGSSSSSLEAIWRIPALIDLAGSFQPLSLEPSRTWNTIFALFVPLSAVCLYAVQAQRYRRTVLLALVIASSLSALVAVGQALGGDLFYLYRITNLNSAVGLFANRNHQSILLLWLMMSVCFYAGWGRGGGFSNRAQIVVASGIIIALAPLLILTGSRAGLALSGPTLVTCAWLLLHSRDGKAASVPSGGAGLLRILPVVALFVIVISVYAILYFDNRNTAISRLFEGDAVGDRRFELLPTYLRMAQDFFPFGTGFGSFESVFKMYEPVGHLSPHYMNQAHNDLFQLAIEGGVPALAVLLAGFGWLCWASWKLWHFTDRGVQRAVVYLSCSMGLWFAASLVDYPLRTPLAAMIAALLTAELSFLSTRAPLKPGGSGQ